MKLKTKILILMGSLVLLVFAVNVGIASADHPAGENAGDVVHGGLNFGVVADGPGVASLGNFGLASPNNGISNNPLCPLHYSEIDPGEDFDGAFAEGVAAAPWNN